MNRRQVKGQPMIYFDNAATTRMKPPQVAEAVAAAINDFGGVGRGVHEASLDAGLTVFRCRRALATLFNAPDAKRVVFAANVTEALNVVISGLLHRGDHAITTAASHNSVLRPLYRLEEQGAELSFTPVDERHGCNTTSGKSCCVPTPGHWW